MAERTRQDKQRLRDLFNDDHTEEGRDFADIKDIRRYIIRQYGVPLENADP